jgi:TnpA family transposase
MIAALAADDARMEVDLRRQLAALVATHTARRPPSRVQAIRARLVEAVRPVRSLLKALVELPWQAAAEHPVIDAMGQLRALYARGVRRLPDGVSVELGSVWRDLIASEDRERALRALEVASLLGLRRALRNGSVWIAHSFAFRSRDQLFLPEKRWRSEQRRHYARLALPHNAKAFLHPLLERVGQGLEAVAQAAREGVLRIDDELHLTALAADEQDPEVVRLRSILARDIHEAQLPEIILAVDARVRFSWIMLGREPRSAEELLMVYAGLLAHGTSLSAAETARMIPPLSAIAVRQAMRWAADERRLAEAYTAVIEFMHRHPIAATWGRADLASSDSMSLETSHRIWQARLDPRRKTPSIGIYTHVHDRWGVFYAQPIVLNERQAGVAIEGVVRQERLETAQLAVDTHGYTDFAMALARLLGFDLCPRLKELKQRRLYLPRGFEIPEALRPIAVANVALDRIERHWDELVHLAASVHTGHASAVDVLARFGAAARGDPLYEAGVQLGRLLRTVFLCDYFVKNAFRRELLRVLNRGEAVNAMKRALYAGRVAGYQAKRDEEMQAVADALSLLANIVMAWNTAQMQSVIDGWNEPVAAELIGHIAPTRIEGINLRGIFRFPIERFADELLPSSAARTISAPAR